MIMFSIFDIKAKTFSMPFFEKSKETAIRAVATQLGSDSLIARYPEDFVLYQLCVVDEISGVISDSEKEKICRIDEIYEAQKRHDENGGALFV